MAVPEQLPSPDARRWTIWRVNQDDHWWHIKLPDLPDADLREIVSRTNGEVVPVVPEAELDLLRTKARAACDAFAEGPTNLEACFTAIYHLRAALDRNIR